MQRRLLWLGLVGVCLSAACTTSPAEDSSGARRTAAQALSTFTGAMVYPRFGHEAVLLSDGRVLVVGGLDVNGQPVWSLEAYRPDSNSWQVMNNVYLLNGQEPTVVRLGNGKVLLAGGTNDRVTPQNLAYLFDPTTNTVTSTAQMNTARKAAKGALMSDGRVMVAGGTTSATASVELYDPTNPYWFSTSSMRAIQTVQSLTRLPDGRMMATGLSASGAYGVEVYTNAGTGWTPMPAPSIDRNGASLVALASGKVLVVGGPGSPRLTELFDPATNTWGPAGMLTMGRSNAALVALPSGDAFVLGGKNSNGTWTGAVDRWSVASGTWTGEELLREAWSYPAATLLANGSVLVTGKVSVPGGLLYSPGPCVPTTCEAQGKTCGSISDGCGGTLSCGTCAEGMICSQNVCAAPPPPPAVVTASYDAARRIPVCSTASTECTSGTLLNGRAQLGPELNAPNTINAACADGTSGTYHIDESLDRLRVVSVDGTPLAPGKQARIEATVWVWSTASDALDLWAAADANSPAWSFLGTVQATATGSQVLSKTYTLPGRSGLQVVRGVFRYVGGATSACVSGPFNDQDDLAFVVGAAGDTNAPTTTVSAPSPGSVVGGTVNVVAQAGDDVGVSSLDLLLDDAPVAKASTGNLTWPWDTTRSVEGVHVLRSRAVDTAGNTTFSDPVAVKVDNTAPFVTNVDPAAGSTVCCKGAISATVTDANGVADVLYYVDGQLVATTPPPSQPDYYKVPWDSTTVANGTHTLVVRARDTAGNVREVSSTFSVQNDLAEPTVAMTAPAAGATLSSVVVVAASASDDVGVAQVDFYANELRIGTDSTAPYSVTWDTRAGSNGAYTLVARARDTSGKIGTSDAVTVVVLNDQAAPVAELTAPASGAILSGSVPLTASATDDVGITLLQVREGSAVLASSGAGALVSNWDTTAVGDGPHVLYAVASDASGKQGRSADVTVVVDNLPPQVSSLFPSSADTVAGAVTLAAQVTDIAGVAEVRFFLDGTLVGVDTSAPYALAWDSLSVGNGSHQLMVVARDGAGHEAMEKVDFTVLNDREAPAVALHEPADGATLEGAVGLTAFATDDVGVTRVELYDGDTLLGEGSEPPYSKLAWDTRAASNGAHVLSARAYDASGKVGVSAAVTVTVDNDHEAPVVSLTSPPEPTWLTHGTLVVSVASRDTRGVTRVELLLGNDVLASAATDSLSVPWDTSLVPDGVYTLRARAYDAAGNVGTSDPAEVTVDNTLPELVVMAPTAGATLTGTSVLAADASDALGVTEVRFELDALPLGTLTQAPWELAWDSTVAANGEHQLTTIARDLAGNERSVTTGITVFNDHEAPVVALTAPVAGTTLTGDVMLTADASDDVGVTRVEFYAGDVLVGSDESAPFSLGWSSLSAANGSLVLSARAFDAAGRFTTSAPVTVQVLNDREAPVATITSPANQQLVRGTVPLTAVATDDVGVTHLEIRYGDKVLASSDSGAATGSLDTTQLFNGSHMLYAYATDASGKQGTSQGVAIRVDNAAPSVSGLSPSSGTTVAGAVTLTATVRDQVAVAEVHFSVDGVEVGTDVTEPYEAAWDSLSVANGEHAIAVTARDTAGNEAVVSSWFYVKNDRTAPTVYIYAPSAGASVSGLVTIKAGANDDVGVTRVEFYDGEALLGVSEGTGFRELAWDTRAASNGTHVLRARAWDASGKVGTSKDVAVTVNNDVQPPAVAVTSPLPGAVVRGTVAVGASAADDVGVTQLDVFEGTTLLGSAAAGALTATWDTLLFTDGPHTLRAQARDAAGNVGTSTSVVVTVDNTAPSLVALAPAAGATVQGAATLAASATDGVQVAEVRFSIDGFLVGADTLAPYELAWDSLAVGNGAHTLTLVARDTAGNEREASVTFSVLNDREAPTVALTAPATGTTLQATVALAASASDDLGVTRVEFYDGETLLGSDAAAPYGLAWDTRTAGNGAHVLRARAYDASGKVGVSADVTVTLANDFEPPAVTLTGPADGATVSGYVSGSITATDNVGVTGVRLRVDGQVVQTFSSASAGFSWDSRSVPNGVHTLDAAALDAVGNEGRSTAVRLTVDNDYTAPQVALTAPAGGTTVRGAVLLTATASDNVGVTRVEFYEGGTLVGSSVAAPYALEWNSFDVANGAHTLTARALDAAGNTATSAAVTVQVSNAVPTVAAYDTTLAAPLCAGKVAACDSGELLVGRGPVGPEPHAPNAAYGSCSDGSAGSFHVSESLDRLLVYSTDGGFVRVGAPARVVASVWASSASADDALDLYVARDGKKLSWTLLGTLAAGERDLRTLSAAWTPSQRGRYVLRGVFRYQGSASPCAPGSATDVDDLVVDVQ